MSATETAVGVLPLIKPAGPTSHDVVARARRWFPGRRVGHLGTLDPAAAGLLLVAVGEATRAARFLDPPETIKHYRVWAVFGLETDGDDFDGRVVARQGAAALAVEAVARALAARVGRQSQVPPNRSAVRVDGRHAYRRVRAGESVTLLPREVVVDGAEVLRSRRRPEAVDLLEVLMEVRVRRGAYIRALVRDLGRDLGTGACVRALVRGRVGSVVDADGLTLEECDRLAAEHALGARLLAVDRLLADWPVLEIALDVDGRRVGRGRPAPPGAEGWMRLTSGPDAPAWALGEARGGLWRDVVRLARMERVGVGG